MGFCKGRWTLPTMVQGFQTRHGRSVYYLRRPGMPKVRLHGIPGSPDFMAAYAAAKSGEVSAPSIGAKRTVDGTVSHGLVSYYKSTIFTGLAKSSQKMRRAQLERFRNEHGDKR